MPEACPNLVIQPSDVDEEYRNSVAEWTGDLPNVHKPIYLDAASPDSWEVADESQDIVFNANMIHITPFQCCEGLLAGTGKVLRPDGRFFLYGPFKIGGEFTSESNADFDKSLRSRDPSWGIRDAEEVERLAADAGMKLIARESMPANNFTLVFEKR